MPMVRYTDAQKDDMIRRVDKRRAEGLSLIEACKAEKVNRSVYSWWRGRQQNKSYAARGPRTIIPQEKAADKIMGPLLLALDDGNGNGKPSNGSIDKERLLRILERILELD
jgi:hypothetical protein